MNEFTVDGVFYFMIAYSHRRPSLLSHFRNSSLFFNNVIVQNSKHFNASFLPNHNRHIRSTCEHMGKRYTQTFGYDSNGKITFGCFYQLISNNGWFLFCVLPCNITLFSRFLWAISSAHNRKIHHFDDENEFGTNFMCLFLVVLWAFWQTIADKLAQTYLQFSCDNDF